MNLEQWRRRGGFWRLLGYPLRRWRSLLLILGLTAATSALAALQPWPLKILVDYALGEAALPEPVQAWLERFELASAPLALILAASLGSLLLFACASALEAALAFAWAVTGQRMVYELAADLFHRLQRRSLLLHYRKPVGDALTRLTTDSWCVQLLTDALLVSPSQQVLTLATIGAVAWAMDPHLALLSLVVTPALAASAFFFGRVLKERARLTREAKSRVLTFVHQTLAAMPVVQAFGMEERNRARYHRLADAYVASSQRDVLLNNSYKVLNGLALSIGTALVLFVGGQRVLSGALSLGSLLVFLAYLRSVHGAVLALLRTYGNLKSIEVGMERVLEVLEADEGVREAARVRPLPERRGCGRRVCLERVTVGYVSGRAALHEIDLDVGAGETVALVGPTGAGKTTLASLIPRFLDPWSGRVGLDGVDLRELALADLRAEVALVLQEPFLLPLSVAENIAYGRPDAGRRAIEAAAVAANADTFIRDLPDGYDSVLGEGGATLSGGQRQRLALARAFLKDAPVLILDEPTSALDSMTEAAVLEAATRLMRGRTTLIIAHRLSTVRHADRIVVLEAGRIVETGSHHDLLAAHGLYHRLHHLQAGALEAVA